MPETKRPSLGEKVRDLLSGPLVAFGRGRGRRDEADGAKVAGYRLVRGPRRRAVRRPGRGRAMSDEDPTRTAAAWHEAGHLAAGILHAGVIAPEGASIRRGHWTNGLAHVSVPIRTDELQAAWWQAVGGEQLDPALRDAVERDCYILLAGGFTEAVAEQRGLIGPRAPVDNSAPEHRPRYIAAITSGEPKPAGDSANVDELLRWACADDDEQAAYRRVLECRADTMVRRHPQFWPLAEAFARELLIHDELSGAQVAATVADVNGEDTPDAIPASA